VEQALSGDHLRILQAISQLALSVENAVKYQQAKFSPRRLLTGLAERRSLFITWIRNFPLARTDNNLAIIGVRYQWLQAGE